MGGPADFPIQGMASNWLLVALELLGYFQKIWRGELGPFKNVERSKSTSNTTRCKKVVIALVPSVESESAVSNTGNSTLSSTACDQARSALNHRSPLVTRSHPNKHTIFPGNHHGASSSHQETVRDVRAISLRIWFGHFLRV
jgi:hypothetical protein